MYVCTTIYGYTKNVELVKKAAKLQPTGEPFFSVLVLRLNKVYAFYFCCFVHFNAQTLYEIDITKSLVVCLQHCFPVKVNRRAKNTSQFNKELKDTDRKRKDLPRTRLKAG